MAAIHRSERTASRYVAEIRIKRSDVLFLILAVECGPAVGGYRLTRTATVERRVEEFDDSAFAAAGGRMVVPLELLKPGYYTLGADVVCPKGRASTMIKLAHADVELCRRYISARTNPRALGASLNVRIWVA